MFEAESWSLSAPVIIGALTVGYLLGSIPFGIILTRFAGLGDIRAIGSGNIGATNVLRTGHKGLAALTLVGDALKGTVAVYLGSKIGSGEGAILAGLAAFLGHLFPVWLRFKGGKGVATYLGVLAALHWPSGIVFAAIWLGAAVLTRYSSAGALSASIAAPISLFLFGQWQVGILFVVLTVILWLKHLQNIARIAIGSEGRIGQR
jgi:glycerol-3-phosphate acyltransferase PlsY